MIGDISKLSVAHIRVDLYCRSLFNSDLITIIRVQLELKKHVKALKQNKWKLNPTVFVNYQEGAF